MNLESGQARPGRALTRWLNAAVLFCLAMLALLWTPGLAGAAPQGPWQLPASTLTAPASQAFNPQVATAPDGTTTVAWQRLPSPGLSVIEVATRPPGGSFGPPLQISSSSAYSEYPALGVAPDGRVVVAWIRDDGLLDVVETASRAPGAVFFSSPEDVSGTSADIEAPQVAVTDGRAYIVWSRFDAGKYIVQQVNRPGNGSFSSPQDLSVPDQDAKDPQVVIAPDGTTTIAWHRFDGADTIIQERTRPPGDPFSPANNLSLGGADSSSPRLGVASDGSVTAAWLRGPFGSGTVQVASRSSGQQFFGDAVNVSEAGGVLELSLSVSQSGGAALAWTRNDVPGSFIIQSAGRAGTGAFSAPVDLTPSGQSTFAPAVVTSPDGTVTVAWSGPTGIASATRAAAGSFGPATNLSGAGFAIYPELAVDGDGRVTAVWQSGQLPDAAIQAASTAPGKPDPPVCSRATLKLGKSKLNRKSGTARLTVRTGTAGKVTIKGSREVKAASRRLKSAGRTKLPVRLKGTAARKLKRNGSYRVRVKVLFKATGCPQKSRAKTLKLIRR
jgi:hypothetical protein